MELNPSSPTSAGPGALIPTGQEKNIKTNINNLQNELIYKILESLPFSMDPKTSQVCKLWNLVVQKLPDPILRVFGKEAWEDYYNFEVEGEAPPLPKRINHIIKSLCRRYRTAILLPKGLTVDKLREIGLTVNKLREIMYRRNEYRRNKENITKFEFILAKIRGRFKYEKVKESYWFVITNDVIEGSRNKSYAYQTTLVGQKTRFELPKLHEIACRVMHHVSSRKYLFGQDPWIYTRCQEQILGFPFWLLGASLTGRLPNFWVNVEKNIGVPQFFENLCFSNAKS